LKKYWTTNAGLDNNFCHFKHVLIRLTCEKRGKAKTGQSPKIPYSTRNW